MVEDHSFSKFAELKVYKKVNEELVASVPGMETARNILDIGAGTGVITRSVAAAAPLARVLAIEPDIAQIHKAQQYLNGYGQRVDFVQGRAEDLLPILPDEWADAIFFCNAFHLLSDEEKIAALREIHRILKNGGYVGLNTAFAAESMPKHIEVYYTRWVLRAKRIQIKLQKQGLLEVPKQTERATARTHNTLEEYKAMLCANGLKPVVENLSEVIISREGWEAISRYGLFIEGVLPGVPYKEGSEILLQALDEKFSEDWPTDWTRVWVQLVAQKV